MKIFIPRKAIPVSCMVLLLAFSTGAFSQSYIDEDFLEILEKNASFLLKERPSAFANNTVPDKWNKESAVILDFSRNILFDKKNSGGFFTRRERSLYFFEKNRLKIQLNDNNAVKAFSEIYFRYGSKEDGFIARVIKPGDTATTIDLKNAVGIEQNSDIPEFFSSFFDRVAGSNYQYYKVPIANLEPGDILEYVAVTKSKLDVSMSGYIEFSPIYEVCSKKYPIMHNEIIIETDDKSYFKSLSLNGAPSFKKESTSEKGFFRYVFSDKNREVEKDINFVSPLLQYPLVKFQVIYSNNDEVKGAFIGDKGELKSNFAREELALKAWEDYEKVGDLYIDRGVTVQAFINECWKELTKLGAKSMSDQDFINTVYYQFRNKVVFRSNYLSDKVFAYIFGSLLFQKNIKSEVIISIGNSTGKLNDILFEEEIRYVIRIDKKLYYNITDFSNPGELEESLLDNEAYIITAPEKKTKKQDIKPYSLPGTTAADNSLVTTILTELTPDMKSLKVARNSAYTGIQKSRVSSRVLGLTPYMFDDYRNYGGADPTEKMKSKEAEEYNKSVSTIKEEYAKKKPETVKDALSEEFSQRVTNVSFKVISDGRTQKKNTLSFNEGFELPDFVRRAGKKYLVNLAGLTGSQLRITPEERDRKNDIDVRYPRMLKWNIDFKIPAGYTAEGLAELNKSVDNETGTFTITAKQEKNLVQISIQKVYKMKSVPKERWKDMLSYIDAAYNSTFKYILLTPTK